MDLFTRADLRTLLTARERPCVSLFLSTHRGGAEVDAIRFRVLLAKAEEQLLAQGLRNPEVSDFLQPLQALRDDTTFWRNQCDGLAAFLARDFLRVYRLPCAFQDEVEVGGHFLVSPVLPLLHGDGRFFVLALSQNSVRLLQGTRFTISPVDLKGVPRSLADAMRTHDKDEVLTFHTRPTSGDSWAAIFQGHGVGIDDKKDDLLRYCQGVDRGLHALLREEKAPLVLVAVDYVMPIYRQANTYPHLLENGIDGNADRLSDKELHERAWAIVTPRFQESLRQAIARYHHAAKAGKATNDVARIVLAAYRGKCETTFIARGKHLWGILDPATDSVAVHQQQELGDEDLLNLTAIHTLRHGNTVYALHPEEMPGERELAAIGHLPMAKHGNRP
jgi:hypothetical protein